MSEERGTQILNLPVSEEIVGSDLLVKQNSETNRTENFSPAILSNFVKKEIGLTKINSDLNDLQSQIDGIIAKSDITDIVQCYDNEGDTTKTDLMHYDTSALGNNDIIEVLTDETHDNTVSYYRYDSTNGTFNYIGSVAAYYTKTEVNNLLAQKVNISNIINNLLSDATDKPLSAAQGKELKRLIDQAMSDVEYRVIDKSNNTVAEIHTTSQGKWCKLYLKGRTSYQTIEGYPRQMLYYGITFLSIPMVLSYRSDYSVAKIYHLTNTYIIFPGEATTEQRIDACLCGFIS